MHEDLLRSIRACAGDSCDNCKYHGTYMDGCESVLKIEAANAIEELRKVVEDQKNLLMQYGGETGIRQLAQTNFDLWRLLKEKMQDQGIDTEMFRTDKTTKLPMEKI